MGRRIISLLVGIILGIFLIGLANASLVYTVYEDATQYSPTTHTYDIPDGEVVNVTIENRGTSGGEYTCITFNYLSGDSWTEPCQSANYLSWSGHTFTNPNMSEIVSSITSASGTHVYIRNFYAYDTTGDKSAITISLYTIGNNEVTYNTYAEFNTSLSMIGVNKSYYWKNTTYYLWDNGGYVNYSTVNVIGEINTTSTFYNYSGLTTNKAYYWNTYACYQNSTHSFCNWASNGNFTFYVYSVSYSSNTLFLNFNYKNGTAANISGYVADYNKSYVFTNVSYLRSQYLFDYNLIYVRLINGVYSSPTLTWENKSQFYEYNNVVPYAIYENITIMENVDTSSYFQVQDNAGNFIKNAIIRAYITIPGGTSGSQYDYGFIGQRIVDSSGLTVFPLDSTAEIYLTVSANGYKTGTFRITASEITTFTATDPKILRLQKSAYKSKSNVFLSTLYKLDGSRVYESEYNNLSSNYYMFIYDYYGRELKYRTSYEGINHTITMDDTTKTGVVSLVSGTQFSSTVNSTWILYLYVDGIHTYEISFAFNSKPQEVIFDVEELGLKDSNAWRAIVFFLIVTLSSIIGLAFGSGAGEDVSVHAFFIGSFIATLMVSGMGWLALTGGFFYFGKMVKKWYSE